MGVLVVKDDAGIAQFLNQGVIEAGHTVDVVEGRVSGLTYALAADDNVLVIDIQLPLWSELELLKKLRSHQIQFPVLFLTAGDTVQDRGWPECRKVS